MSSIKMSSSKMESKKIPFVKYSFDVRQDLSRTLLERNSGHIPCIIGFSPELGKSLGLPTNEIRILVESSLTVIELLLIVRKKVSLKPEESCFLFVCNTLVPSTWTVSYLYSKFKKRDGFLYLDLRLMETFGWSEASRFKRVSQ
jgi:hypothetical protein